MISTLHIKNIGIIDDITIDLNRGFNVFTGETGAGKTLIIDSLGIISGGRFSKEMIRNGEDFSCIELCLYMPENENNIDGNIIVSREIHSNGRNLCKINGRLVTVNELKSFMSNLIDIHGQNDNQYLLDTNTHIKYLDNFAGEDIDKIKDKYKKLYSEYIEINSELKKNYGDDKEKQRKLDLLQYQVNEIQEANLKINEEEELENERKIMMNSEKISENLNEADTQISQNAIDSINVAIRSLEKIENLDDVYIEKTNDLKSIYYDLQELSRDILNLKQDIYFDNERREQVEERLDLIFSLKRKYGNSIEEILKYKDKIEKETYDIENLENYTTQLKEQLEKNKSQMKKIAESMNEIRKKYALKMQEKIDKELKDLEMKNAKFYVDIQHDENEKYTENGLDVVEFKIKTNIGDEAKPLVKIASGGEMSRIMLAIKTVLADVDEVPILIFDEIDTGISGIAAKAVSEKIKKIAQKHQVICVTHLAPIAARGDYNYFISKKVVDEKTKTNIQLLSEKQIISEIARIASGEITSIALEHAKELRRVSV